MPDGMETSKDDSAPAGPDAPAQSDAIAYWAQAWADFFGNDAAAVDEEVHSLCNKIRSTLNTIEGRPPAA